MYGEAALQFVRKRLGSRKEDAVNPQGFGGANVFHAGSGMCVVLPDGGERLTLRGDFGLAAGIAAGELPAQDVALTAAALVGGCGEALVGPLSPLAAGGELGDAAGGLADSAGLRP